MSPRIALAYTLALVLMGGFLTAALARLDHVLAKEAIERQETHLGISYRTAGVR